MNYLEMLRAVPPHRTALIEDSRQYTYGEMVMDAQRCSDELLSHQKTDKDGTAKSSPPQPYHTRLVFPCWHGLNPLLSIHSLSASSPADRLGGFRSSCPLI